MIDMAFVIEYISPIILVACLCIGFVIKHAIPNDTINKFIPLINLVLGVGFNVWATGVFDFQTCVIGGVSGLASTGLYEAFKNVIGQINLKKNI